MVINKSDRVIGLDLNDRVVQDLAEIVPGPLSAGLVEVHVQGHVKKGRLTG